MKRKSILLLLVSALALGTGCSRREQTVIILETTDVHGSLFNHNLVYNSPQKHGLAHAATIIREERAIAGRTVFLLDNGDILQGTPATYYANYVDTLRPHLVARAMNLLRYDAGTVGNHDIEAGPAVYRRVERELKHPWLAANIVDTRTEQCAFKPYAILERDGVRVAVIGLTTPSVPNWLPPQMWSNMRFDDMVQTAQRWVDEVRRTERPDIVVGLFHAGHDYTYQGGSYDQHRNENASIIVAQRVPGFDLILIGHDHDLHCRRYANPDGDSVLVLDPASNGRYVARATIRLRRNFFGRVVHKTVEGELLSTEQVQPDPEFSTTFAPDLDTLKRFVSQPLGTFSQRMSSQRAYFGPTAFIDFIHRVQLEHTGAEVSFVAPLSLVSTIEQGQINMGDMFKLYRFENFLYTMKLYGHEIKHYLEYSATQWFNTMTGPNDHLLKFKLDAHGQPITNQEGGCTLANNYYNLDCAAGLRYQIDVRQPDGHKVRIMGMADGRPFYPDSLYSVAINSYRGNGGGGHLTVGVSLFPSELRQRQVASSAHDIRHLIAELIRSQPAPLAPQPMNCWQLVPTEWTQRAAERDFGLLFPPTATPNLHE
ncbi:MAG: bifunctional metallophosphatase/5'-nucleotidase [Bacteroidales bacterium]|nr:bifunctional metallophosphatase/5'-nucleotidase [Bacteroidales bacterium]